MANTKGDPEAQQSTTFPINDLAGWSEFKNWLSEKEGTES